ncbi:MAG: TonB-dependent receptor, partial [Caulobacteraceae bacterium]|nr:TonB-dependent receptor [Caulobacteraceae bacterium]
SDEIQALGKSFDDKLNWVTGLYFDFLHPPGLQDNFRSLFALPVGQNTDAFERNLDWSDAVYAQGTYDLSDWVKGLKFTAGARYTYERNKSTTYEYVEGPDGAPSDNCLVLVTRGGAPDCVNGFSSTQKALTWTLGLEYQINDKTMAYVTGRRGFKGGGYQLFYDAPDQDHYGPEYIEDVEVGVKSDWRIAGMRARTDLDIYRSYESQIQRLVIPVIPPYGPESFIANSADAVVQGIEFEGTLIPVTGVRLGVKYAYTNAAYDRAGAAAACGANPASTSFCPLNPLQNTPQNQLTVDLHYTLPIDAAYGEVTFGGSLYYQSKAALTDNAYVSAVGAIPYAATEPAYDLINLDGTWSNVMRRPIDLSFFMTNVANKLYRVGSDDLSYNVGFVSYVYGEPRMFGLSAKYHFGGR